MSTDDRQTDGPAGSAPEFSTVYEAEVSYVCHTLRRLGVRPADVEDAAHDVFIVVHRRLFEQEPGRPLRPWLFGISLRVASERRRRAAPLAQDGPRDEPDPASGAEEALAAGEDRALVRAALDMLDLDQRVVLVLHDIDGLTAKEIAGTTGAPLNTVYSRLRLARVAFTAAVTTVRRQRGEE